MEPSGETKEQEEVVGVVLGTDVDAPVEAPEEEDLGVQVGPGSEQVKEEEADANVGLELGDLVIFRSTRADIETVKGRIYYIDESRVSIMEEGKTQKIVVFDMEEDEDGDYVFKEEYNLTGAEIKEKRLLPSFVAQRGMAKDMLVETFTAEGEPLVTYTIKDVDEVKDSATILDEAGEELVLDFAYKGIPKDRSEIPFDVLRVVEPPKKEDVVPNEAAKGEVVEEELLDFEFLDELEAPDVEEVVGLFQGIQKPAWEMLYNDDEQINDMLRERIRDLDPAAQRSVKRIRAVTRLVWSMMGLRNDVTRYSGDKPVGRKPVAYNTLVELLEKTQFPLAKLVLNMKKAIYVDYKFDGPTKSLTGNPTDISDPQILLQYLQDILEKGDRYLLAQLRDGLVTADIPEAGLAKKIPRWITVWQGYFNKYLQVVLPLRADDDVKDIRFDQDFFRYEIPNDETKADVISGFPILKSDNEEIVTVADLKKIPYSYMRALGARYGRYGEGGLTHKIEDADQAEIKGFLIFPLKFIRDLGYIRSGILMLDVIHGMEISTSMKNILKEADSIVDVPEANRIVSVSFDGSTLGNIQIADWLKGQAIYGGGIGDLMPYLRSFGLLQAEFTLAQKLVLDKKVATYRSGVKQMLRAMREDIKKERANRKPRAIHSLLSDESQQELFTTLINENTGEKILKELLETFNVRHPSYKGYDLARFAYLYNYYPDLLINTLAQNPEVAKERLRAERDIFIQEVLNTLALEKKLQDRGQPPEANPCQHVKDLTKIRMIEDNSERMLSLNKFVRLYKLKKEDHWLWCNNGEPAHHLLCEHEYLLLQEFLRPKEREVIHKEIIITFGGGKFNGQYVCRQCGQPIAEYEYDNHLEYSDSGQPMAGRAVLVDEDAIEEEKLQQALTVESEEEEKVETQSEDERKIYLVISEIASLVGVFPDRKGYEAMITRVKNAIALMPDRGTYAQSQRELKKAGKVSTDYDVFISRVLVCLCAASLLIDVQTHVPDYIIRYTLAGCASPEFSGYPRDPDARKPDTGIEYLACAISSITKRSEPWDLTGFQTVSSTTNRIKEIKFYIKTFTEQLSETPDVQQKIIDKKQYLLETFGLETALGRPRDIIPYGFTPSPFVPTKELAAEAEAPVVIESASEPEKVRAYIKQAHIYALKYGKYLAGSKFTEASCCYNPLTKPTEFWGSRSNMPDLPPQEPPKGPTGSHLFVFMKPRILERIFGKADASIMYRLFLRVCFRGPRMGKQHEPGYDHICPWCEFKFPDDPRFPPPSLYYSKDSGKQKKYDDEYQSAIKEKETKEVQALKEAGISEVTKENFEELLISVNKESIIPPLPKPYIPKSLDNLRGMLSLDPKPFEDYEETIRATLVAVEALPADAPRKDVISAFDALARKTESLENELRTRMGDANFGLYQQLIKTNPQDLGEALRTYFLVPFQRILTMRTTGRSRTFRPVIKASRNKGFSLEVQSDLQEAYYRHTDYLESIIKDVKPKDTFILAKLDEAVDRLTETVPFFIRLLRPTVFRGGNLATNFIQRSIVAGIFAELIMPNHIPPNRQDVLAPESALRASVKILANILKACLLKYQQEGLAYSEEQIRELIQDRMEKEKALIMKEKNDMTPEQRKLDGMLQRLGMGKWAVGGTKAIWRYDPNQYVSEKDAMEMAGITRFAEQVDVYERDGGYDVEQTTEDNA